MDFRLGKTQKEEIRERSASCRENRLILLPIQNLKSKIQNWLSEPLNSGKLILDATCAPADISYPTDIEILNEARKHTEKIIDALHGQKKWELGRKPRTYRKQARKDYLEVVKKRRIQQKERRKAIKKQLHYIQRNLAYIDELIGLGATLESLTKCQYKTLLVVTEVYRQQLWLYENKTKIIEDRIVSLTQPHIRPIIRGKAGKHTEFGAKLSDNFGFWILDFRLAKKKMRLWREKLLVVNNRLIPLLIQNLKSKI